MVEFVIDTEHPVVIPAEQVELEGLLHIPREVRGIILFVHGSGSSRLSPRNQYVARLMQNAKFATLLFDLLTPEEDILDSKSATYRFNLPFLCDRLLAATRWIHNNPVIHPFSMGYFGASTGGGAALLAAAQETKLVKAVVSRGGRPDLAGEALAHVLAPTLLLVGGNDQQVIKLNEQAYAQIQSKKEMIIIPGASHLFEEEGKLDDVARFSIEWFKKYL